jgi:hypothetical protein
MPHDNEKTCIGKRGSYLILLDGKTHVNNDGAFHTIEINCLLVHPRIWSQKVEESVTEVYMKMIAK